MCVCISVYMCCVCICHCSMRDLDSEIRRLGREIELLEQDMQIPNPANRQVLPDFSNLPNCVDPPIPTVFERAPITCPFNATRALEQAAIEKEAFEFLTSRARENPLAVLHKMRNHQFDCIDWSLWKSPETPNHITPPRKLVDQLLVTNRWT